MKIELRYIKQNKPYQMVLDRTYNGSVVPKERYINPHAIILHHCLTCNTSFYARPEWLINLTSQRHICGGKYNTIETKMVAVNLQKEQAKVTPEIKELIIGLCNDGLSKRKIAKRFNLNPSTVSYHLKRTNLN